MNSFIAGNCIQLQILTIDNWVWLVWHRFPNSLVGFGDIVTGTEDKLGLASDPERGPNLLYDKVLGPNSSGGSKDYEVCCFNSGPLQEYKWRLESLCSFLDSHWDEDNYNDICELNDTDCIRLKGGDLDVVLRRAYDKVQLWVESIPHSYHTDEIDLRGRAGSSHGLSTSYINTTSINYEGSPPFLSRNFGGPSASSEVFDKYLTFFRTYIEEHGNE